jgi:ABC-2 type transport system ATP-binding protein
MLLALSQRPDLLVLDEPTDGLDPVVRRDVLAAVLDYVSETGATVFISSHLVHELERICDWVGVMDRGRLIAELPMQQFKNGIKRLRIAGAPASLDRLPFTLLSRQSDNGVGSTETWIVRGWEPPMRQYLDGVGATLRDVIDLDLEEGFVELLRSSRPNTTKGAE